MVFLKVTEERGKAASMGLMEDAETKMGYKAACVLYGRYFGVKWTGERGNGEDSCSIISLAALLPGCYSCSSWQTA